MSRLSRIPRWEAHEAERNPMVYIVHQNPNRAKRPIEYIVHAQLLLVSLGIRPDKGFFAR